MAAKLEGFNKQLGVIEAALGFPINGETMAQIFRSGDAYLLPSDRAGEMSVNVIFQVSDKDKLNRLISLAEKAADAAATPSDEGTTPSDTQAPATEAKSPGGAEDEATTATGDTAGQQSVVAEEQYKGVTVKRFAGANDSETFYTILNDLFLVSTANDEIRQLIDRVQAGASASSGSATLASLPDYQKTDVALAQRPGEMYLYTSRKGMMAMQQNQPGFEGLQSLMQKIAPVEFTAVSIKFAPKQIVGYTQATLAPGKEGQQTLFQKYPGDKPLEVVNYIPANPLIAVGTSLVDTQAFYAFVQEIMSVAGVGKQAEEQMKQVEEKLGFSIKNDLVPAIGNEAAFAINSFKISAEGPAVDGAIVLRVGDRAKLDKVLASIDKLMTQMTAGAGGTGTQTPAGGVKTAKAGDSTIRYIEIPGMATLTPGYAIHGDYLIIATTQNAIKNMIGVKTGSGQGLVASDAFKKLGPNVTTKANMVQFFNFKGVWDTLAALSDQFPIMEAAGKIIDALRVFQVAGSSSSVQNGMLVGESVLVLQ